MRILVTGAAGFIGSHACQTLAAAGHRVTGIDNFDPYYPQWLKLENLKAAQHSAPFIFKELDILRERELNELLTELRPEAVIHLAARPGVAPSVTEPGPYIDINVKGTLNVLRGAARAGSPRVIFASSSSVYGGIQNGPCTETDLLAPLNVYAATKIAGEALCQAFSVTHGVECVCLRFFTVYGPRQRPDMAIAKFANAISAGRQITLRGDASSARDYTFISDIVNGISSSLTGNLPSRFEVFNLGNSQPILLRELVGELGKLLGKEPAISEAPLPAAEAHITCADIGKASKILNYRPTVKLQDGLREYVAWLRTQSDAPPLRRAAAAS